MKIPVPRSVDARPAVLSENNKLRGSCKIQVNVKRVIATVINGVYIGLFVVNVFSLHGRVLSGQASSLHVTHSRFPVEPCRQRAAKPKKKEGAYYVVALSKKYQNRPWGESEP